jgi:hypothetical protein
MTEVLNLAGRAGAVPGETDGAWPENGLDAGWYEQVIALLR